MASIVPSSVINDIRGKLGDQVYGRNPYGLYVRSLGSWIQPDTSRQLARRAFISTAGPAWSATLTEQQREDWRSYGRQHLRPNKWGTPGRVSGYANFIRHNAYRYMYSLLVPFLSPPSAPPLHPPEFSFTASAATQDITVVVPPTNYDPPPAMLQLFLFVGKPVTTGRNFFNGPWRFLTQNLSVPPWQKDPWTIASPWPIANGQRMWCYLVAQAYLTGELSGPGRAQYDVP